jgi:hypothetical protein
MPTPNQIRKMKDFDNTEYFVVHEVVDLPDSDEEIEGSHEDDARRRITLQREPNQPTIPIAKAQETISDPEDDFEPQNATEREWKRKHDEARRQAARGGGGGSAR